MLRAYWLIASVVVAGCAPPPPPPPNGTDVELPAPRATDVGTPSGSPVEKTIGPAGGTLASADGLLAIDVPAGALAADTLLGVQPLTNTAPSGLGPGFRLTPAGATFSSPVKLTFKPTTEQLAGTVLALTGIGYQDASGFWRWMRGVERDEASGSVSVATTHFSSYSLIAGAQLQPPSASVQTSQQLSLSAVVCYTVPTPPGEEELAPVFSSAPEGEEVYPVSLINKLSNWSVNGIAGGNDTVGTITGGTWRTKLFTAPKNKPSPATVAVSVDVANLELDGQTFAKAVLVSNVTIGDAGEVQTWRGPVTLSWTKVDSDRTASWQLAGTVEFGQPYDRSSEPAATNYMVTAGSTQISNYHVVKNYTGGPETCTGDDTLDADSGIGGGLVFRKSPSEYGLDLHFSNSAHMTCTSAALSRGFVDHVHWQQNEDAVVGSDYDGNGEPAGCGGMKFIASPPDARSLTGSATWSCPTWDGSYTATLTWDLTGSP